MRIRFRCALLALTLCPAATAASAQTLVTDRYDSTFRKYAKHYFGAGFDWRLFKAQALTESRLQVHARSPAGARGIMQLLPTTYQEVRSRNPEIKGRWDHPEWNIAAGIALSRRLWNLWTADAIVEHLREFMLGSYNAGRLTLLRAQKIAEERALDPKLWPSIEQVAPAVPRWRHDETLNYLARTYSNLAAMDSRGQIDARRVQ